MYRVERVAWHGVWTNDSGLRQRYRHANFYASGLSVEAWSSAARAMGQRRQSGVSSSVIIEVYVLGVPRCLLEEDRRSRENTHEEEKDHPRSGRGCSIPGRSKNYRVNALLATGSPTFLSLAVISNTAKRCLHRFLLWGQKAVNTHNTAVADSLGIGKAYLGTTPLSKLVTYTSDALWNDLNMQLLPDTEKHLQNGGQSSRCCQVIFTMKHGSSS